jgi:hypothetical protein
VIEGVAVDCGNSSGVLCLAAEHTFQMLEQPAARPLILYVAAGDRTCSRCDRTQHADNTHRTPHNNGSTFITQTHTSCSSKTLTCERWEGSHCRLRCLVHNCHQPPERLLLFVVITDVT